MRQEDFEEGSVAKSLPYQKHTYSAMDILILNNCSNCNKEEWTRILSPYYLCADCSVPKCPKCQDTEVMFVVTLQDERRTTQILKCLSEDCMFSEDIPIDYSKKSNTEYPNNRRWSLKVRNCVSRKLNFDIWNLVYHNANASWGMKTLFFVPQLAFVLSYTNVDM